VTISLSGSMSNTAITDSSGNYQFTVPRNGTYTVTPSLAGYTFTPPNASFVSITANQTANFVATVSCLQSLNPTSVNVGSSAATGSIAVTAPAGCNWTAVSNAAWITITAGSIGSGNGTVSYSVTANAGAQRTGTISIGGQTFTVNQAAGGSLSIFGLVSYGTTPVGQPTKYVAGVNLNATGASSASAVSNSAGNYQLSGLLSGGNYTVTPSKTGDVNSISSFDASLVARRAASLITLTPNQMLAADVSGNGTVSSFDASLIARTAAGIATSGNSAGQWKFVPGSKPYANLTAHQSGQDYEALLMGEVSGNWLPPSGTSGGAASASAMLAAGEYLTKGEYLTRAERAEPAAADLKEEAAYQQRERLFGSPDAAEDKPLQSAAKSDEPESAAPAAGISVSLPVDATASTGTVVVVPVVVGNTSGQGIFSYDLTVSFNPNVLQPATPVVDATNTLSGAAGFSITPNVGTPGQLTIGGFGGGATALSGAGTLIFLRFTVVGTAGTATGATALTFTSFVFNEGMPQAKPTNGALTVTAVTAASVTVAGRVMTQTGRGIRNVTVTMTDGNGNSRMARSTSFGYYRFETVAAGQTYTFTASGKRFTFSQPSQVRSITGTTNNIDFVADPQAVASGD